MRLGFLGGSFDPPHVGHVALAERCRDALGLERVFLIPAYRPPHKLHRQLSPFALRLAMVKAAIAGRDRLEALTLEAERGGVSYTVDTLRALRARYAGARFWLCMGTDSLREIASWRDPVKVAAMARFAVYRRGEEPVSLPASWADKVDFVGGEPVDVSSTQVRERVALGLAVDALVAPGVLMIMRDAGLYRTPESAVGQEG